MNTVEVDAPKSPLEICVSLTKFCLRLCAENDSALLCGLKLRTRNGKTVNQLGVWGGYMSDGLLVNVLLFLSGLIFYSTRLSEGTCIYETS